MKRIKSVSEEWPVRVAAEVTRRISWPPRATVRLLTSAATIAFSVQPGSLLACAACYGQSDSPMAQGMNWGIFSLLAVIVSVLGGITGFFIFLARKSASSAS
jgi:hypothetical protein